MDNNKQLLEYIINDINNLKSIPANVNIEYSVDDKNKEFVMFTFGENAIEGNIELMVKYASGFRDALKFLKGGY